MDKKIVYVTGAGRGIGRSIALKLADEGYEVWGCSRTLSELEETRRLSNGKVQITAFDATDEVQLGAWFMKGFASGTPWGLVTAAGIYGPIGPFFENDFKRWLAAININLNGTALAVHLFSRLLIEKNLKGRIFLMSGGGATQPLPNFSSYCASKAAVVRFGETVAHELRPFGISVISCAPGAVNTRLTDELIEAGPTLAGSDMYAKALKQKEAGGTSPDKAADFAVYFMSGKGEHVTAKLISAVWDPWSELHEMWPQLEHSDIYTLKRITPEDRPQVDLK